MPKLVCTKCQTELRPSHNGTIVIEMASFGPYKVWYSDCWKCPGCGNEVAAGFADQPLRQDHFADDFAEWLESLKKRADRIVYDFERPQESSNDLDNFPPSGMDQYGSLEPD